MMEINTDYNAPDICLDLKDRLVGAENCKLVMQLDYRDNHTIIDLKHVSRINFKNYCIEILQKCGSASYYAYEYIMEYHIVNNLSDIGGET